MRIAIPTENGRLCTHFGHCQTFALIDVDTDEKQILASAEVVPPPHEPGLLPRWLKEQGAQVVIAGGMGGRAVALFAAAGVEVITGAPSETPEALALAYVTGTLEQGDNACDH